LVGRRGDHADGRSRFRFNLEAGHGRFTFVGITLTVGLFGKKHEPHQADYDDEHADGDSNFDVATHND